MISTLAGHAALGAAISVAESDETQVTARFADAGLSDTHLVVFDWGDGSAPTVFDTANPQQLGDRLTDLGDGRWEISATHVYVDDDPTGRVDNKRMGIPRSIGGFVPGGHDGAAPESFLLVG